MSKCLIDSAQMARGAWPCAFPVPQQLPLFWQLHFLMGWATSNFTPHMVAPVVRFKSYTFDLWNMPQAFCWPNMFVLSESDSHCVSTVDSWENCRQGARRSKHPFQYVEHPDIGGNSSAWCHCNMASHASKHHDFLDERASKTLVAGGSSHGSVAVAIRISIDSTFVWSTGILFMEHFMKHHTVLYVSYGKGSAKQFLTNCCLSEKTRIWPTSEPNVITNTFYSVS